jgi:hypothetical protein
MIFAGHGVCYCHLSQVVTPQALTSKSGARFFPKSLYDKDLRQVVVWGGVKPPGLGDTPHFRGSVQPYPT